MPDQPKIEPDASAGDAIGIISAVGHELRSPLTSIRGYTSLLMNRWDRLGDDDKLMMIGQISHDAERVTRLINELLDISRLETGHLNLTPGPTDLADLARSVVASVAVGAAELDVTLAFPDDLPTVTADPDKLEQVLTNLVENAAKYGSPVGLVISGSLVDDNRVSVTVTDQGNGIEPGDLDLVFERWFQRDQGRPTGTGLGLWISRGLVEAHGGTLTVESPPGQGAAFTFTIPIEPPAGE